VGVSATKSRTDAQTAGPYYFEKWAWHVFTKNQDGVFKFYPKTLTYETKIAVTLVTLDGSDLGYVVDTTYAGAANPLVIADNSTDIWTIKDGATGTAPLEPGRGLHSSTFRLNVSTLCGIGGAFRGCLGVV